MQGVVRVGAPGRAGASAARALRVVSIAARARAAALGAASRWHDARPVTGAAARAPRPARPLPRHVASAGGTVTVSRNAPRDTAPCGAFESDRTLRLLPRSPSHTISQSRVREVLPDQLITCPLRAERVEGSLAGDRCCHRAENHVLLGKSMRDFPRAVRTDLVACPLSGDSAAAFQDFANLARAPAGNTVANRPNNRTAYICRAFARFRPRRYPRWTSAPWILSTVDSSADEHREPTLDTAASASTRRHSVYDQIGLPHVLVASDTHAVARCLMGLPS